jgi:GNAT superfamily N-acetyltransferase
LPEPKIRPAKRDELETLRQIELAAGQLFSEVGRAEIAEDEPASLEELREYADRRHAWVLADEADQPIGYVLVDVVDGCAHIEQVSVHPDYHRQGHGRRLIDRVTDWARHEGMPAVTLTTFRDVPWNAPYYARCGFRTLTEAELKPELAAVRAREAEHGLDPETRVCMRLDL